MERVAAPVLPVVAIGAHVEVADRAQSAAGAADPDEVGAARGSERSRRASPARRKRRHQSASSQKRKNRSSRSPTCSHAARRATRQAPESQSTSYGRLVRRRRARGQLAPAHGVVREEAGQRSGATEQGGPAEGSRRAGALYRPVAIEEPRAGDARRGWDGHELDQRRQGGGLEDHVGVQEDGELRPAPHGTPDSRRARSRGSGRSG